MADQIIRPADLPARESPVASEIVPVDNQVTVAGATIQSIVEAGRPAASQTEAEAGTNASKAMVPLTTKQAIDAQVPSKISTAINALDLGSASQSEISDFATAAQGGKADTAIQEIIAGDNTLVDNTDPIRPVVSSTGGVADGDKGDVTVSNGSADWVVNPGAIEYPKLAADVKDLIPVSPSQFGGSVSAALAASDWIHIDGNYQIGAPIVISKPNLKITSVGGATITYTGGAGSDYAIRLNDVSRLDIGPGLTIDCDSKVANGLHVRAVDGAPFIKIDGLRVLNPFAATPTTVGAEGIFVQCDSGRGEVLTITRCHVMNVSRSVVGSTCCGITANDFKTITVTDNIVDGVYKGSGSVDADGIKVFSQLTGADYEDALVTVENNTVINCEGRFVKTQTRGKTSIRNNIFRIDKPISLQTSYNSIDCQIDGATIEDNFFDLRSAWTGGGSMILCYMRAPTTNPTFTGQQVFGSIRNNKVLVAASAPDISRFCYLDLDALSSRAYTVAMEVEGNFATTTSGWGSASIGVYAGTINVPVSWAAGATANIVVRNNKLDTSNWFEGLRPSGGSAAHGGLGDLTSKLSLEFSGNGCPRNTDIPVMEYVSNQCFTSSMVVFSNSIGISCNRWTATFDFRWLKGGNDFYLPTTAVPAHLNSPSSFTFSIVSRKGLQMVVDMFGGIKTNKTISVTNVGVTPVWV